jgi:hypothetical protein
MEHIKRAHVLNDFFRKTHKTFAFHFIEKIEFGLYSY